MEINKTIENTPSGKSEGVVVSTPRGRESVYNMYKEENPDSEDEVEDDRLYDFMREKYSSANDRLGKMDESNARLNELVAGDPRLGLVLSMIAGEDKKSLPYAIGKVYGKEFLDLDKQGLEDFEAGYQENLKKVAEDKARMDEANENIKTYSETLAAYAEKNGLSEEEMNSINDAMIDLADNILMGKIDEKMIDNVYKGINYDTDVEEAANAGLVEGRNQKIDAKIKSKKASPMADLGDSTGAGTYKEISVSAKKPSFYESLKDEE